MTEVLGVFVSSLLGSWHCAGMCGPFSVMFQNKSKFLLATYHLGRLLTYCLMVMAVFYLGVPIRQSVEGTFIWHILALIMIAVWAIWIIIGPQVTISPALTRKMLSLVNLKSKTAPFLVGAITTTLPCPWLYGFVILATTSVHFSGALVTISVFWLGTIPALMLAGHLLKKLSTKKRRILQALSVLLVLAVTLLRFVPHHHHHH